MAAIASAPRVVIAGAGPGGLAAASLLREAGAIVTVLERAVSPTANPARNAGVVVGRESWDVLKRVGGGSLLDDARNVVSDRARLMSLSSMDDVLGRHAETLGVDLRRGVVARDVVDHGDRISLAIEDSATGARELLDADWYVDATGGTSDVARSAAFRRHVASGPMQLLPAERSFVAIQADAIPSRGPGWNGDRGSFAINDRVGGTLSAYLPVAADDAADAIDGPELLRLLGIEPATSRGSAYRFTARQSLADTAAQGRILLVGDSVGTVMPATQMGTSLALLDGERAAAAIVEAHHAGSGTPRATELVADYAGTTRLMHQAFIR